MSSSPGMGGGRGSQGDRNEQRPAPSRARGDHPRRPRLSCHIASSRPRTRSDRAWLRDEDVRLHQRLLDRDESALLGCLDRFGHIVYCTSLVETGDSVVAEMVTKRVFVQLWRRPEAFDPRCGPLVLQLVGATLRRATA